MGIFGSDDQIRIRINEKGHLVEEVRNMFAKTVAKYRENEWVTVWSSAPINHNTTIGVPTVSKSQKIGYKLVLDDSGTLNLYDAVGALIWCSKVNI